MDGAVVRFMCKKLHKWRGTYQRIFLLTPTHVVNVDPGNWNVTNSWAYDPDLVAFSPSVASDEEFTLTIKVCARRVVLPSSVKPWLSLFPLPSRVCIGWPQEQPGQVLLPRSLSPVERAGPASPADAGAEALRSREDHAHGLEAEVCAWCRTVRHCALHTVHGTRIDIPVQGHQQNANGGRRPNGLRVLRRWPPSYVCLPGTRGVFPPRGRGTHRAGPQQRCVQHAYDQS